MTTPLASRVPSPPSASDLRDVPLRQVRAVLTPECYRRRPAATLAWLAFDAALYAGALAGVFLADPAVLRLVFGALAGCAVAFLFIWAHDAAHGALFRSARWAEVLGTAAMLPSLQLYRPWVFGHNRVHHGFTSLSPVDWIWRPLTPAEYRERSPLRRAVYRVERHPAGCALHYLLRVWWRGMVRYRPERAAQARSFRVSKAVTAAFAVVLSVVAFVHAGGPVGVLAAVLVPFLVFTWFIAFFVYLHHTHPQVPFFLDRDSWSPAIGNLACTTVIRSNPVVEALTHNILVHTPHHVDSRIPFYRLKQAYADLRPTYGAYVHEYRLRWREVRRIFRACQLYEFDTRTWRRFRDVT